jgi:aminoglycoside phosphotransferase (APT) family kinase protein
MSPSPSPPDAVSPADDVSERVLDALAGPMGARPEFTEKPAPLLAGAGPDAHWFELATDDPYWSGVLVARVSSFATLRREVTWLIAAADRDFAVPRLLTDRCEDGVLVFRPPGGDNLTTRMTSDLVGLPDHLASFGRLHANLHNLPIDGLVDDTPPALAELHAALDLADSGAAVAVEQEMAWLDANRPPDAIPVLCHGHLNPVHVYVRADNEPGPTVTVDWTQARLAEPELDVGGTLVSFWTSPLYVPNRAQRAVVKLARDALASAYLAAYGKTANRPLDEDRLRYWQAFHLCRLAADLAVVAAGGTVSQWAPASNAVHPDKALRSVRSRFWDQTRP